jgi:hypothetical protein
LTTSALKQRGESMKADEDHAAYLFDHVLLDSAEGYNSTTGLYTTPIAGHFAVSVEVSIVVVNTMRSIHATCKMCMLHHHRCLQNYLYCTHIIILILVVVLK